MSLLHQVRAGLRTLFRKEIAERELDDELRDFLERSTQEKVRAGMSRDAAERAARLEMGGVEPTKELVRSAGWESKLESLVQDVRYAVRGLGRNAAFTTIAVLTLALGIGATTTMFSVVNAVMLRPLPYRDPGRLVLVWTDDARRGLHREGTAYRTITDWQASTRALPDIAYFTTGRVAPVREGPTGTRGRTRQALVSGTFFATLGVAPTVGRALTSADETNRSTVAVISYSFWQRWFAGASDVLGRTVSFDDGSKNGITSFTVIGVMPPGFHFPDKQTEIFTPATTYWRFTRESAERFPPWARRWTAVGRLAPGASVADARADLARIGRQLSATYASDVPDFPGFGTTVAPMLDFVAGPRLQSALWLLLGATALVLLVACANVAHLLLARGATRQQELAVRRALGGGRGRLLRQLVAENVVLGFAGGLPGVAIAALGTRLLGTAAALQLPRMDEASLDARVLSFAVAASLASALVFGVVPAFRLSGVNASELLTQGEGWHGAGSVRLRRNRGLMVLAECSLAIVLLAGAGLLLRSLNRVQGVDPGFDPLGVLALRLEFPPDALPSTREANSREPDRAGARAQRMTDLLTRLQSMTGVDAAGFVDDLFISGQGNKSIAIPGHAATDLVGGELNDASATPGFFRVMHTPLRRGRSLTRDDVAQKIRALWSPARPGVTLADEGRLATVEPVVVNEAFVRRFFPGEDPVGKRFCIDPTRKTYWYEIVGVVGDMHRQGLERPTIPEYFGPYFPVPNGRADLVVRTQRDPRALASTIRQEVLRAWPSLVVVSVSTVDAQLGDFSAQRRLQTWLLTAFAGLALTLAAIGIFGLVHYTVAERKREIGVRMALGASPGNVLALVIMQGMRAPLAGIAIGLVASALLTRTMSHLLYGVSAKDPATFVFVAGILTTAGLLACYVAARRSARVDPMIALRG